MISLKVYDRLRTRRLLNFVVSCCKPLRCACTPVVSYPKPRQPDVPTGILLEATYRIGLSMAYLND